MTEGIYEFTITEHEEHTIYAYRQNEFDTSQNVRLDLHPAISQYRKYTLSDESYYEKYDHVKVFCTLSGPEFIYYEDELDISNPLVVYAYDNRKENVGIHFVKPGSATMATDYQTVLNETASPSMGYHCNYITTYRVSGQTEDRFYMYYDDANGFQRRVGEQLMNKGIKFEYIDDDTGELIYENNYTKDHDFYVGPENTGITYLVKVTFPDQFIASYFAMTYDLNNGLARFEFIESEKERMILPSNAVTATMSEGKLQLAIAIDNDSGSMVSYNIRPNSEDEVVVKDTVRVSPPYGTETISVDIDKEELIGDHELALIVLKNGNYHQRIPIMDLLATDVTNHWACGSIISQFVQGNVYNRSSTQFEPGANITRGEFATFLSTALTLELGNKEFAFNDLKANTREYDGIQIAASNGLINGYPDGTFREDNTILRQDLTVIIGNALSLLGVDMTTGSNLSDYIDTDVISPYALDSMSQCVASGILTGKTHNQLEPKAELTRAEAVVIIERVLGLVGEDKLNLETSNNDIVKVTRIDGTFYYKHKVDDTIYDDRLLTKKGQVFYIIYNLGGITQIFTDQGVYIDELDSLEYLHFNEDKGMLGVVNEFDVDYVRFYDSQYEIVQAVAADNYHLNETYSDGSKLVFDGNFEYTWEIYVDAEGTEVMSTMENGDIEVSISLGILIVDNSMAFEGMPIEVYTLEGELIEGFEGYSNIRLINKTILVGGDKDFVTYELDNKGNIKRTHEGGE